MLFCHFCSFILDAVDGIFRCSPPALEGGSKDVDNENDEEGEQQGQELHPDVEARDAAHHWC